MIHEFEYKKFAEKLSNVICVRDKIDRLKRWFIDVLDFHPDEVTDDADIWSEYSAYDIARILRNPKIPQIVEALKNGEMYYIEGLGYGEVIYQIHYHRLLVWSGLGKVIEKTPLNLIKIAEAGFTPLVEPIFTEWALKTKLQDDHENYGKIFLDDALFTYVDEEYVGIFHLDDDGYLDLDELGSLKIIREIYKSSITNEFVPVNEKVAKIIAPVFPSLRYSVSLNITTILPDYDTYSIRPDLSIIVVRKNGDITTFVPKFNLAD